MRVLVVGGTGVLGRAAVPRLVTAGHDVTVVTRRPEASGSVQAAGASPIALDVFDPVAVAAAAGGMDAIVNLATSIPPTPKALRRTAWRTNDALRRDASRVLAHAAITAGARFVQESFAPTYRDNGSSWITEDHPLDPIEQTRTVADAEASADRVTGAGGAGVVLRFGLFYDAASAQTRDMVANARRGFLLLPGPASAFSSMIFVPDAATAVVAALSLDAGRYNVVDDEPLTRADHASVLGELLGRRVRPLPAAVGRIPVLRVLARSHRISNDRLRAAGWAPSAPSVRQGWKMVLEDLAHGRT